VRYYLGRVLLSDISNVQFGDTNEQMSFVVFNGKKIVFVKLINLCQKTYRGSVVGVDGADELKSLYFTVEMLESFSSLRYFFEEASLESDAVEKLDGSGFSMCLFLLMVLVLVKEEEVVSWGFIWNSWVRAVIFATSAVELNAFFNTLNVFIIGSDNEKSFLPLFSFSFSSSEQK
jgi:hypothetical protein